MLLHIKQQQQEPTSKQAHNKQKAAQKDKRRVAEKNKQEQQDSSRRVSQERVRVPTVVTLYPFTSIVLQQSTCVSFPSLSIQVLASYCILLASNSPPRPLLLLVHIYYILDFRPAGLRALMVSMLQWLYCCPCLHLVTATFIYFCLSLLQH